MNTPNNPLNTENSSTTSPKYKVLRTALEGIWQTELSLPNNFYELRHCDEEEGDDTDTNDEQEEYIEQEKYMTHKKTL